MTTHFDFPREMVYGKKHLNKLANDDLKIASDQLVSVAKSSLIKASLYNKKEIISNWN